MPKKFDVEGSIRAGRLESWGRLAEQDEMILEQIGGVDAVWSDTDTDNMLTLRFRVGQADETLATRGFTHLAEHLALRDFEAATYPYNGGTGQTVTSFMALTSAANQVDFARTVCERLTAIADGTMDESVILHEAKVLKAEARQRQPGIVGALSSELFGAQGLGLFAHDELGLIDIPVSLFRQWVGRVFTKQNAVAAIHNEPHPDLSFEALLDGERLVVEDPTPMHDNLPAFVRVHGGVGLIAPMRRKNGNAALTAILSDAVTNDLRRSMGVSYAPSFGYSTLSDDWAFLVGVSDITSDSASAGPESFVRHIERLATDGPTDEEVTRQRALWVESKGRVGAIAGRLEYNAEALLHGGTFTTDESIEEQWAALDVAMVATQAKELATSYLLGVPASADPEVRGVRELPQWTNVEAPAGKKIAYRTGRAPAGPFGEPYLRLSESALSMVNEGHRSVTVQREDVAVLMRWHDGVHQLVATHGKGISIIPNRWSNPEGVLKTVKPWLAPHQTKLMGFRANDPDAWDIPSLAQVTPKAIVQQVHILDGVGWHLRDSAFGNRAASQAFVRGALSLGWLADRNLLADWVEAAIPEELAAYRSGEASRIELYQAVEGLLATDMMVDEAKVFLVALYAPKTPGRRDSFIERLFSEVEASPAARYDLTLSDVLCQTFDRELDKAVHAKLQRALSAASRPLRKRLAGQASTRQQRSPRSCGPAPPVLSANFRQYDENRHSEREGHTELLDLLGAFEDVVDPSGTHSLVIAGAVFAT